MSTIGVWPAQKGSFVEKTPNAEAMAFVTLDTQLHIEPTSIRVVVAGLG
jgi:hypothetical protein